MYSFYGWVILHCVYVSQLSYPFSCWWTSRLLPCSGYYKQCCDEHWGTCVSFRIDAFELWCWRRFLRVPWTAKRSNQSILKEIGPGCSWKDWCWSWNSNMAFGHLMWRVDSLGKTDAGRDWEQEEKRTTEDEMAGWHHWLDGHEFEWTPGVGDGQGGLACCDSWDHRVGHDWATELSWNELTF